MKGKIIILCIFIVFLAGCASSPKGNRQMIITITDIPSEYEGMVGAVVLDTGRTSDNIAWSLPAAISGGVNENYMMDWVTDNAWNKEGTYRIIYIIYINDRLEKETASSFIIRNINFKGNVFIPFSQFVYVE